MSDSEMLSFSASLDEDAITFAIKHLTGTFNQRKMRGKLMYKKQYHPNRGIFLRFFLTYHSFEDSNNSSLIGHKQQQP